MPLIFQSMQCFFLVWKDAILCLAAKKTGQAVQFVASGTPVPALSADTANEQAQSEVKYLRSRIFSQYRPEINAVLFDAGELAEIRTIVADDVQQCIIDDILIMPEPINAEQNPTDLHGDLVPTSGRHSDSMPLGGNVHGSPGRAADQTMFGQLASGNSIITDHDHDMNVIRESVGMQWNPEGNVSELQSNAEQVGYSESRTEEKNGVNRSGLDDSEVAGVPHLEQLISSEPNSMDRPKLEDIVSGDIQFEENVSRPHQVFSCQYNIL